MNIAAQNKIQNENTTNRKLFSSLTIGAIEILSFSLGYQINDNFSVAIKAQNIASGGGGLFFNTSEGIGLSGSYYFKSALFNSIKLSITPLLKTSYSYEPKEFIKGFSLELATNREKIYSHLFRFYYELGIAYSKVNDRKPLLAPIVKVGVIYNF
jgi:hypothetical protein